MKNLTLVLFILIFILGSCSTQKQLGYLNNLPETGGEETFSMEIPGYNIQNRDLLYISAKAMTPDGMITELFEPQRSISSSQYIQSEVGQYVNGYSVDSNGDIALPVVGKIHVLGLSLEEARYEIQKNVDRIYQNATVDCKLLSFKVTVLGEVRNPGTYFNYNTNLTVLEALGRAGGISDLGRRDKIIVIRPVDGGTRTFSINLQDKAILSSEGYFLQPNDVIIIEPHSKKIFNLNLPTYAFIVSTATSILTTTLLLVNYFNK